VIWERWRRSEPPEPTDVGRLPEVHRLRERRQRMKAASWWARRVLDLMDRDGEELAEALAHARDARRPERRP
jgi:hypothetical protein